MPRAQVIDGGARPATGHVGGTARVRRWLAAALLCALPGVAAADLGADARKISSYEAEARLLATDLPRPNQVSAQSNSRRLVGAQVAFGVGDYDAAALALLDLVRSVKGGEATVATFYLAEALFQKGDRGAARAYYAQLVDGEGPLGKYFQPSLERLVEIAILQKDATDIDRWLGALDRLPPGQRRPSVPYVLGKYAFSQEKYDQALAYFQDVPKGSDHELQALYFSGAVQVARKDLAKATELYVDLLSRKPRTSNDRRVIELAQLALGRLYYERDQPSRAIDAYLLVDRRSDLFTDALFEVSWVYVKNKQYDKALRALELLAESDPQSTKIPTVKILEGNLRIRKAQMLKAAQVAGAEVPVGVEPVEGLGGPKDAPEDPAVEYEKASKVFTETHDAYAPSYEALAALVESKVDPANIVAQVAGRNASAFQVTAAIPEAAASWLRDVPEVQRVVDVETSLGDVEANLHQAEDTIARLQGVIAATNRTGVYPALSARRLRIAQIEDDLIGVRTRLATEAAALLPPGGPVAPLTAARAAVAAEMAATPNPERAYDDHVSAAREDFGKLEDAAREVEDAVNGNDAVAVALRKYSKDAQPPLAAADRDALLAELDRVATDDDALQRELVEVRREIVLGRDLAGASDDTLVKARELRHRMRLALDAEHRAIAGLASSSRDAERARTLVALGDRAARLAEQLDQTEAQIDQVVDGALAEVKAELVTQQATLREYAAEYASLQAEARQLGGGILAESFRSVKDKFYDVIVRTDVGDVDVHFAQKEDADEDLKRLNLARARESKQLKDEFRDLLDAGLPRPSDPTPPAAPPPPPPAPDASGRIGAAGTDGPSSPPPPPRVMPDAAPAGAPASPKAAAGGQGKAAPAPAGAAAKGGSQ